MDNELELVLRARDQSRQAFAAVLGHLQGVQTGSERSFGGASRAARAFGVSVQALQGIARNVAASIAGSFQNVGASIRNIAEVAIGTHLANAFQNAAGMAQRAFGVMAQGAQNFVSRGIDMNLTLNGARTALTALLGSESAAAGFLQQLQAEAAKSIPTLKDLLPVATQLVQAYGVSGLGKVIPTIRAFGDAAAIAAGGDTNRMGLALLGFRQLLNRGVAQQEELNQIGENLGVNVSGILKQAFGTADTETLAKANITGQQVADAIVAGLQSRFGGAQAKAAGTLPGILSNIQDALNSIAGGGAQNVLLRLTGAAKSVLETLTRIAESGLGQKVMQTLLIPLEMAATAVEKLVGKGEDLLKWIDRVATADGIRLFMLNGIALLETFAQKALQFFGVDLAKLLDPKNIQGWFEALGRGVEFAVNGFFGLGRVWREAGTVLQETLTDLRDSFGDFWEFASNRGKIFFALTAEGFKFIAESVNKMVQNAIPDITSLGVALNALGIGFSADIGQIIGQGVRASVHGGKIAKDTAGASEAGRVMSGIELGLAAMDATQQARISDREAEKLRKDPRRKMSFGERISSAFMGTGGVDTRDQENFWLDFRQNRANAASFFFGGATPAMAGGPNPNLPPVGERPFFASREGLGAPVGPAAMRPGNFAGWNYGTVQPVQAPALPPWMGGPSPDPYLSTEVIAGKIRSGQGGDKSKAGFDVNLHVNWRGGDPDEVVIAQKVMKHPEFLRMQEELFRAFFDREYQAMYPGQ